ncbi:ABC transporter permease subunit [Kitasatospora sp. NPDC002551]|uniref:ABC transporter permease subunit n=1 Tax=Kitasatospora sp. NPDC002551 TaxID=3154539 RepID=UPI003322BA6E
MSTSTLTGPPAPAGRTAGRPAAARRSRGPRGVFWLSWQQSRVAVRTMAIPAVLTALILVALHFLIQDRAELMARTGCEPSGEWTLECRVQYGRLEMLLRMFTDILQPAITAVPILLGTFLGGPLLAQEYERGTLRMVLAQSVGPGRWLAARLAVPAAAVLLLSTVVAALTSWVWWSDIVHSRGAFGAFDPPFQGFTYPVLGVAPVAWSLFGLALGVLVGQLLRRTVAAVLVSGAAVALAHTAMIMLRPHLWPVVEREQPYNDTLGGFRQPTNAWLVEHGVVLADGTRMTSDACMASSEVCSAAPTSWGQYHPVSHLVPIQLVEAGLLLALTAVVVVVVFRRLTRAGI